MNEIVRRKAIIENIRIVEKKGNGVEINDIIDLKITTCLKKTQIKIKLVTHFLIKKMK